MITSGGPNFGYDMDAKSELSPSKSRGADEDFIVQTIAELTVMDLGISDTTSRIIVTELLKRSLERTLSGRNGLLQNYYNKKLEKLLPGIYLTFDLKPEDLEINKNHSDDSKLYTIFKSIKERYNIDNPKRQGMPRSFGKNKGDMDIQCESSGPGY